MRWSESKSGGCCFARTIGEPLECRAASSCRGSDESVGRPGIAAASSSRLRAFRASVSLAGYSPKVDCREDRKTPANAARRVCGCRWREGDSRCSPSFGQPAAGVPIVRWSELVERDRRTVARSLVHVATDHFFFEASFGSLHSFHVLVRRILTLAVLSICRTVSMAMASTIFSRMKKSRSFGNDQRR